jgi:hypothetical protein
VSVCLLAISDGRHEYHHQAFRSALQHLPRFDHHVFIDDPSHELGFTGAVIEGWRQVLETDADFVWHFEADFTFDRPIPIADMVGVLTARPYLTQMALLRQPWNDEERAAGSIYNLIAAQLTAVTDGNHRWLEHRRPNTTNPSLWPRWVLERGWPNVPHSEGIFGGELMRSDDTYRAAYWGQGEEWCEHIGAIRAGRGY